MIKKQNLHTHTTYADGKNGVEELILEALDRGFDSLGFSEHTFLKFSSYPNQLTREKTSLYKDEVLAMKEKYKGKIDVFLGLEYDSHSDEPMDGYDYLIGSVHYLDCGNSVATFDTDLVGTKKYLESYFGGDAMAFAKKYYSTLSELPSHGKFDIIGHFDLISKNNSKGGFFDAESSEYLKLGYEAIHALRGKIPFFEVNTGAISRGYTDIPYPSLAFLREFRSLGFGALITSDCHDKRFLDCGFDMARELLAAAGFTSRWVLTEGGFEEIEI